MCMSVEKDNTSSIPVEEGMDDVTEGRYDRDGKLIERPRMGAVGGGRLSGIAHMQGNSPMRPDIPVSAGPEGQPGIPGKATSSVVDEENDALRTLESIGKQDVHEGASPESELDKEDALFISDVGNQEPESEDAHPVGRNPGEESGSRYDLDLEKEIDVDHKIIPAERTVAPVENVRQPGDFPKPETAALPSTAATPKVIEERQKEIPQAATSVMRTKAKEERRMSEVRIQGAPAGSVDLATVEMRARWEIEVSEGEFSVTYKKEGTEGKGIFDCSQRMDYRVNGLHFRIGSNVIELEDLVQINVLDGAFEFRMLGTSFMHRITRSFSGSGFFEVGRVRVAYTPGSICVEESTASM